MAEAQQKFWIGVVSREHALRGAEGGFIQLNHGKKAPLQRVRADDGVAIYSPRTAYPDGEVLQHFTAIGRVVSGEIYQVAMTEQFKPYRVKVKYFAAKEAPIKPLIAHFSFIRNKERWGTAFRFGHVSIPRADFMLIAATMGVDAKFAPEPG